MEAEGEGGFYLANVYPSYCVSSVAPDNLESASLEPVDRISHEGGEQDSCA